MSWRQCLAILVAVTLFSFCAIAGQQTITIGTINNNDMIIMQELSKEFEKKNPDIKLNWVILEENVLRQRITTDISTNSGQFDIMTIGLMEAPMWGERGWLAPFTNHPKEYQFEDLIDSVRDGLAVNGVQYALPFYAESQMIFYRKDLFDKAGVTMPAEPTWDDFENMAAKLHDPANGVYGLVLRGKPGWGEALGQVTPCMYSYGGRWFDMDWKPEINSPEWKEAVTKYTGMIKKYGPPGSTSNGFNECLMVFASGKAAMWCDATIAAAFLADEDQSSVIGKVAYAPHPYGKFKKGSHYLWSWALAVPVSSKAKDAAQKFIYWATSPEYIELVAKTRGWGQVPAGTRKSLYERPEYKAAAPFADMTIKMMKAAVIHQPSQKPVPYVGNSFICIPEFASIGGYVSQEVAAVLSGDKTVDQALDTAQKFADRAMEEAGYYKKK